MDTQRTIEPGQVLDLAGEVVGLERESRRAILVDQPRGRPPRRIDGYTVGAPLLEVGGEPPHNGEMHPDGDELLYLVSGRIDVHLELEDGNRTVTLGAGQAIVVPRGVWHRISHVEPGHLIHITPGPGGDHRPLQA
jgi:mannose-6-phosphate isomerase-like protein (cupin superfamily)